MDIQVGQEFKQIKELVGFPHNRLNEIWIVHEANEQYTTLKNEYRGLGVNESELNEHFELYTEEKTSNVKTVIVDENLNMKLK